MFSNHLFCIEFDLYYTAIFHKGLLTQGYHKDNDLIPVVNQIQNSNSNSEMFASGMRRVCSVIRRLQLEVEEFSVLFS